MGSRIQNILLAVLSVALIGLTVAYALLTQQLNINSTATAKGGTWKVQFENLKSSTVGSAILDSSSNALSIQTGSTTISGQLGTLVKPGDSLVYTFDIANRGTIPAILSANPTMSTPTCESTDTEGATYVCENLTYTLTYNDGSGTAITQYDTLDVDEVKSVVLTLTYNSDATKIPSADVTISNVAATLNYIQN